MAWPARPAGPILLTYEDYCALPDDGKRYEIMEGVLYVTPAPTTRHQRVLRRLLVALSAHAEANGLGEVFCAPIDVVLSPYNVVQPDILFVNHKRRHIVTENNIAGPPDLVVEIVSASSAHTDRGLKAQVYARHGVEYYWLVDPEGETLEEYQLQGGAYTRIATYRGSVTCRTRCFPDLALDLEKVW